MSFSAFEGRLNQFFGEIAVVQNYQRLSESVFKQTVKNLIENKNKLEKFDAETKDIFETNLCVYSIYNPYNFLPLRSTYPKSFNDAALLSLASAESGRHHHTKQEYVD